MREYKKREQAYVSDLTTDTQWKEIKPLFTGNAEYTWPKRELMKALLYFVKTGQWRHLLYDSFLYSMVRNFYQRARKSDFEDIIFGTYGKKDT